MKISLTITDISLNEAQNIVAKLSGQTEVHIEPTPHVTTIPASNTLPTTLIQKSVVENTSNATHDKDGLPWDERIHSSNKKLTDKGYWTRRRNVDEGTYNQVVTELRAGSQGFPSPATPVIPANNFDPSVTAAEIPNFLKPHVEAHAQAQAQETQPAYQQPQYQQPVSQPQYQPPVNQMPPSQPVYQQPVAQQPAAGNDFGALFAKIQNLVSSGQADMTYINSLTGRLAQLYSVQINSFNDIGSRPDIVASAWQLLAQDGKQ